MARPSRVRQQILPEALRSLLDPLDVLFEVKQDGKPVVAATGLGDFEIPRGLAFPPGVHTAHLQVQRVSPGGTIDAVPVPLNACPLVTLTRDKVLLDLTRDPLNDGTLCGAEGRLPFILCRPARVTLKVGGETLKARYTSV